ncbi:Hint domain-containing protein [Roseovarius sp. MBR-6]|uniref:Hint domain-containing protein n=1 Tax=Roseovarius sp. MBR-6 TaxID=3156459 RepID=UPI00339A2D36
MPINRVEGDNGANLIDENFLDDPEGDRIDNNDAPDGSNSDVVEGFGGDDTILAGEDNDTVYAGSGNDSVEGGAGDDVIFGDSNNPDATGGREVFQWSLAPDPNDADPIEGGDPISEVLQNTGSVDVRFFLNPALPVDTGFADNAQDVAGVETGGAPANPESSLSAALQDAGTTDLKFEFSAPVTAVSFQINDLDGTEGVQVFAFDADDNLLPVTLSGGSAVSILSGEEAAGSGDGTDDGAANSLSVTIDGPVSQFLIRYSDPVDTSDGINVTDIYFNPTTEVIDTGAPGDDTLIGGDGDDTIFGEAGDDVITGGAGADALSGGDDQDTFIGGTAGDVVDGGSTGVDNDTLDLSGAGPLRVAEETADPDGNSTSGRIEFIGTDGAVTGEMTFAEIENLILPDNGAPVTQPDEATTDEDTTVTIDVLTNDSDPDGDPLTVTDATAPNGTVTVNTDGTITYTPNPDFNGTDTITYTADDGNGGTTPGTVTVTVNPVNDAPVAAPDSSATDFETPVTIDVLANDSDVDGDPLTVSLATPGTNGTTTVNPDGTITYTPDDGFSGTDTFDYTVDDGNGGTATSTVSVTVGVKPPPARDGIVSGTPGDDLIDLGYTGDPDGDRVDAEDAILPGAAPNDDSIRAGDGDDTVFGGLADDEIEGGRGNDSIFGESGNDTINAGAPLSDTPLPDLGFPGLFPADADPENDRDFVDGGDGDDVITTGDDADTIFGGAGNDFIDGGIDADEIDGGDGNDTIIGGEGSDTIFGGRGDDLIYGGLDPRFPDELNIPDDTDLVPDNGRDLIFGGDGNDTIFGQDDADTIIGGAGDDFIDGGIDNDSLEGNFGNDTILGGDGDDTIRGLNGDDSLEGGAGDDVINGGDGDDIVSGGDGDDVLRGNNGNDTISGGAGADFMAGGNDRDVFLDVGAGDTIDGGSGDSTDDGIDDDFDTLDLRGLGRFDIVDQTVDPDGNSTSGTVNFLAQDDTVTGTLIFGEIENLIPCFTPGTLIATPRGEVPVEDLREGDRVITRDNGLQEIRWTGARSLGAGDLMATPKLRPVLIRAGALGHGLPERDMLVSPQHRLLLTSERAALYFGEREVLAAAKHLTGMEGIDEVQASGVTYIHFMCDRHEVVLSNGAWTESFQPGEQVMDGMGASSREEIYTLFPELRDKAGIDAYQAARRSLKRHEARLLVE